MTRYCLVDVAKINNYSENQEEKRKEIQIEFGNTVIGCLKRQK